MERLQFGHFADRLTADMFALNGFATPGPSEAQDLIVRGAVMRCIGHFLVAPQTRHKQIDARPMALGAVNHRSITRSAGEIKGRAGSIVITYYGESHDSQRDGARAQELITACSRQHEALPTLLLLERGLRNERSRGGVRMRYDLEDCICAFADEDELTRSRDAPLEYQFNYRSIWGMGLSVEQRSMVVAGYLAVCLANGNPEAIDRVTILFGSNHSNMLETHLEYFVQNVATNLWARRRFYLVADSLG